MRLFCQPPYRLVPFAGFFFGAWPASNKENREVSLPKIKLLKGSPEVCLSSPILTPTLMGLHVGTEQKKCGFESPLYIRASAIIHNTPNVEYAKSSSRRKSKR